MPSKRNFIASEPPEPSAQRPQGENGTENRTRARPAPAPRTSRGAAIITAPRKSEHHHVATTPRPLPNHEQIARRAYEIWLQTGCASGRDAENWMQAERELSAGCGPG